MKHLFYLLVGVMLGLIILPSCNSSMSITKRRYNKGYYVQHTKHKQEKKLAKSKAAEKRALTDYKLKATEHIPKVTPEVQAPVKKAIAAVSEAPKERHSVKARAPLPAAALGLISPLKALDTADKLIKMADAGDDALSLLWVVVIVLLIVWLLGILFEVGGGFVHILGVIALVLLILWLLKII